MKSFRLRRKAKIGKIYTLNYIASGLENCKTLWKVFGNRNKTLKILSEAKVRISPSSFLIWHDQWTGKIDISLKYLIKAPRRDLYLDFIHELVHLKQFLKKGRNYYKSESRKYKYGDRPLEIEAYKYTVMEAKRIGMTRRQIINYLDVPWVKGKDKARMIKNIIG